MRHLDLFAGIGGFSLAAQWMGWETVAQVEWDEWCQKVLAKNFPNALRFGDIVEFNKMLEDGRIITNTEPTGLQGRTWNCKNRGGQSIQRIQHNWDEMGREVGCVCGSNSKSGVPINLSRIDIITGGFPCQPFSHAGKRKGTDDSRYLWPAMLETIRRVKPTYVVGENVAGLVSMEGGKTLDRILSDLEDEGYTTEQVIIPACAVGAWHRRDRIWIIAQNTRSNGCCNGEHDKQGHIRNIRKFMSGGEEWDIREKNAGTDVSNSENTERKFTRDSRTGRDGLANSCFNAPHSRLLGSEVNEEQAAGVIECGEDVPDSSYSRFQAEGKLPKPTTQGKRTCDCSCGDERGTAQSLVGRMAYGLPNFMDGYWDREPEGISRVVTGVKDRVNRLKGLGNAICPQVVFEIYKAIQNNANIKEE